jgi:hypothetical protein
LLKVRGGCYNYRFKLYVAIKTVEANSSWQPLEAKHEASYVCTLIFQHDIHKNALKNEYN